MGTGAATSESGLQLDTNTKQRFSHGTDSIRPPATQSSKDEASVYKNTKISKFFLLPLLTGFTQVKTHGTIVHPSYELKF